jgi:tetratricopeptide (TPR) repeat protein
MQREDWAAAQSEFQALASAHPELPGPAVNLALILAGQGRPEEARKALESCVQRWPGFAPAALQLGLVLRKAGDFEAAERAYSRAIEADPGYAEALYNRAVLNELYRQKPDQALRDYQAYQRLQDQPDPEVERWIAELKRRNGEPTTAESPSGAPS